MLATAARGGIVAVLEAWSARGLLERWPIEYLPTHCDGSAARKALTALKAFVGVLLTVLRQGPVILHVHAASDTSFWRKSLFMAFGLLAKCPLILHLHGGRFKEFYEVECGPLGRRIIRFFIDRAAYVVVLSESWREWVSSISANPGVVCIPNPVLEPPERTVRAEPHTILFMSRVCEEKGIFDLLQALRALRASIPGLRLICAGEGDVDAVAERARALGLSDAVTFPGWVVGAEKDACLQRASVFVLPSYAEAMPMGLLEAMAAGIPTVSTPVGGIPDVVTDGVDGLLIVPGDVAALERQLRRLLQDPKLAARLAAAARETVRRRFPADRMLAQLERIYAGAGLVPQPAPALRGAPRQPSVREAA
jgi:glycosyltransferase involved in cell wall biosynthesis